jgi:nitroreductase
MIDLMLRRRSIRRYTAEPVDEAAEMQMLRAAMYAPSAGNQQPWHFILVKDRAVLEAIPGVHPHAAMAAHAAGAILVCCNPSGAKHAVMWPQDCAAATQNLLLAAEALGLGAVWLGVYPREDRMAGVAKLFWLPDGTIPFSMVAYGHPAEKPEFPERFDLARIHRDRW